MIRIVPMKRIEKNPQNKIITTSKTNQMIHKKDKLKILISYMSNTG